MCCIVPYLGIVYVLCATRMQFIVADLVSYLLLLNKMIVLGQCILMQRMYKLLYANDVQIALC